VPEKAATLPSHQDEISAAEEKISEELVLHIRGFFATPLISAFARLRALGIMLSKPEFGIGDFPEVPNKKLLGYGLQYLARIGLLELRDEKKGIYKTSELGRQIFRRSNSFLAPHSYHEYLHQFYRELLNPGPYQKQEVDRLENIIGSGRTHERYFPPAISFLRRRVKFDRIADIGCGDGRFLDFVLRGVPGVKAVGIDLSEVSVNTTRENLRKKYPDREIETFSSDASDIQKWSEPLLRLTKNERLVISMWFLLHEISHRDPEIVIRFLNRVHQLFPSAPLVICELVRQEAHLLSRHRKELVMPEYLLFHDLSEQGVLSWKEYQHILKQIPYQLASERTFDEIGDESSVKEPATFVWCLVPK